MPQNEFAPELAVEPRSVDDAREAIEQTRERISATLDEIETRIDATKQELRRRADVLRPVRERIGASPWTALAIGAGAGLALGLLTGGSDDDSQAEKRGPRRKRGQRPERADWQDRHGRNSAGTHEHETDYGTSRLHVHGDGPSGRAWVEAPGRGRGSMPERIVDHLLDAVAGAVSDGISSRIRKTLLD